MSINFKAPENVILKPIITVFGVGGAGTNAVNNMIASHLKGAKFVVANTDAQSLEHTLCDNKIQLGIAVTKGLGAGASPEIGALAAEESQDEIRSYLEGSNMVFITAGMGGGTGTGAAPVIAKLAKELGILTVGVVTKPFHFEGEHRMKIAIKGLERLQQFVDTLIVIPNQNLFRIANERTTFADAFKMADNVLHAGVRGVTDLMIMPGLINLDFADIRTVMSEMGKAMMGTGEASGDDRAVKAAEAAIANPLLDHSSMCGAKGVLINITGGMDMTLFEVDNAANRIRQEVGEHEANIIFGSTFNPELDGIIRVSVVATGIDADSYKKQESTLEGKAKTEEVSTLSAVHTGDENFAQEAINSGLFDIEQSQAASNYQSAPEEAAQESELALLDRPEEDAELSSDEWRISTPSTPPIARPAKAEYTPTSNVATEKKQSLFSKMWNSLRSNEKHLDNYNRDVVVTQTQQDNNPDIEEIPAFLRKPK